jgi:hypothetical protein
MRMKSIIGLAGIMAFSAMPMSYANERLLVQVPAVLDPSAPIANSVKRECALESLMGNHVFQQVSERIAGTAQIDDVAKPGPDKVLKLTILSVHGVGGGSWSGSKAITIRADVSQNMQVIASKVFRRGSRGGVFGGMSGTCSIMERITVALGRDVAKWVPTMSLGQQTPSADVWTTSQPPTEHGENTDAAEPSASEQKQ